jgi:hypothetical protein
MTNDNTPPIQKIAAIAIGGVLIVLFSAFIGWSGYPSPENGTWPDHPDRAFSMDSSWRIAQGQVSHRDFSSVVGPAWVTANALGVLLVGPDYARAMPLTAVFIFVLLCGLALGISVHRSIPVVGVLSILYIAEFFIESPFLEYNGIGYILFWFILLEVLTPSEHSWKHLGWITGALLGVLLFWKLNFFLVALAAVVLSPLIFPKTRQWAMSVAGGFVGAALVFLTLIRWHVGAMIHDLSIPFTVKTSSVMMVISDGSYHFLLLWRSRILLGASAIIFLWAWNRRHRLATRRWRHGGKGVAVLVFLLVMQNLFVFTNARPWAAEAIPWIIMLAWAWGISWSESPPAKPRWWNARAAAVVAGFLSLGVLGWFWWPVFHDSLDHHETYAQIRAQAISFERQSYTASVKEGVELLKKNGMEKERILTIGYSNPFPPLLRAPSVRGDLIWWSTADTFSATEHPNIEKMLEEADVVMEPQWHDDPHRQIQYEAKWPIFRPFIEEHFEVMASSVYWKVWKKKSQSLD